MTTPPTEDELDELREELEDALALLELPFGKMNVDASGMSLDVSFAGQKLQALGLDDIIGAHNIESKTPAQKIIDGRITSSTVDALYLNVISGNTFSFFFPLEFEDWFENACLDFSEKDPEIYHCLLSCEDDSFDLKFCLCYAEAEYGRLTIPWIAAASILARYEDRLIDHGYWCSLLQQKIYNEVDTVRGKKVVAGARSAAADRKAENRKLREQRFCRIAELDPVLGPENAARQCELEGLGSFDAIKRQWNRNNRNGGGMVNAVER